MGGKVDFVGFESRTRLRNAGREPLRRETGAVALWTLGQFPSHEHSIVLLPHLHGSDEDPGSAVCTAYFKLITPGTEESLSDYWSEGNGCAFLRANGGVMTKLEIFSRRALGRLGSIDLTSAEMRLGERSYFKVSSTDPQSRRMMFVRTFLK
jgi:hypothetical protein